MIGVKKEPINRSVKRKKVIFNRFVPACTATESMAALGITGGEKTGLYTSGTLCAKKSENCDFSQNLLKQGVGAELFYTSAGNTLTYLRLATIERVLCVRLHSQDGESVYEKYLFSCSDGYVRVYSEEDKGFLLSVSFGGSPKGTVLRSVGGEERFLIVGENESRFLTADGTFFSTGYSDLTEIFCTCKNRLFVLLKNGKLAYSDPMTPWDLSESIDGGGYIEFPIALGNPIALTAVDAYVYVFFERAIMRVCVKGSGRDFCLEEISYSGGKIVKGSPCALHDGVIFLAAEGLWCVKGKIAQRVCETFRLDLSASNPTCAAAICEEKYFLRYLNGDGGYSSVAVDLDGKGWSPCYDLLCLSDGFDSPLFIRNTRLYRLGGDALPPSASAVFQSVDTDFGLRGKKTLRRLAFSGQGSLTVEIHYDGRNIKREISFVDGKASIDVNVRGETFSFALEMKYRSYLRGMSVEIEA